MKQEIGGYLELDRYRLPMLHEHALALNSGRGCLEYLIRQKNIKKIALPRFCCDVVADTCRRLGLEPDFYDVGADFLPENLRISGDTTLYLVNFYGQLQQEALSAFASRYPRLIVDNAQAYFAPALPGVDTLYTCRKFLGVADGGFLYTDAPALSLERDESHARMDFVLGRFERSAGEFYARASENNDLYSHIPLRAMSSLTENLLHGIDYDHVRQQREENFALLHRKLCAINRLSVRPCPGPYAYPLLIPRGYDLRRQLAEKKIFVPTLWPNVLREQPAGSLAHTYAQNLLPLPCDQRYGAEEMHYICEVISACIS